MDAKAKGRAGMTSSQAAAILTGLQSRFLQGMNSAEVKSILATASIRRFNASSVITSEGDSADHLFLIVDGSARAYTVSPRERRSSFAGFRPVRASVGRLFCQSQWNIS